MPRPVLFSLTAFFLPACFLAALSVASAQQDGTGWNEQPPERLAPDRLVAPEGLEVTIWATSPMLYNPTNMDVDAKGRIWVCEGVNYRHHADRRPEGDRVVVLEDRDGDGRAEESSVFVQDPELQAPLGIAVFDNQIWISQPPHLLKYTDANRNQVFDQGDTREVVLTGFNGIQHDHSLHSVIGGPDGLLYFNQGNTGADFTDADGHRFQVGSGYAGGVANDWEVCYPTDPRHYAGEPSADGRTWVSGFSARMNPDGSGVEIIAHGYRNSYEQALDSLGEMFRNDNDDIGACVTTFVPEGGFFGFCSRDGQRTWQADQTAWQSVATAHWRQEDPGVAPIGDIYGSGAPAGMTMYENGALGEEWNGTLLSADAGRNVVFGYHPEVEGGAYRLEHFKFLTSNPDEVFAGLDHHRQDAEADEESVKFRPSDVVVGADGALYVSDWYDGRVGGHSDFDDSCSGTIYRVAPTGFTPANPAIDLGTVEGALVALGSPAVNVRWTGFQALRARRAEALAPLREWIAEQNNLLVAARGLWLLPHLGEEGVVEAVALLGDADERRRLVAMKALSRVGFEFSAGQLQALAADPAPRVARATAALLARRPLGEYAAAFTELARRTTAEDRGMQAALYHAALGRAGEVWSLVADDDQLADRTAVAWTLHPVDAVDDLTAALRTEEDPDRRHAILLALAQVSDESAALALVDLATSGDGELAEEAKQLLIARRGSTWADIDLNAILVESGVYDPASIQITPMMLPPEPPSTMPPVKEVLALEGDAEAGRTLAQRCVLCHEVAGTGPVYGPGLTGWGALQSAETIARAIIEPGADIAHGFDGTRIEIDGGAVVVEGIVIADGDPVIVRGMGGLTQYIPSERISNRQPMERSLMYSPEMLGLTPQDVRDIVEFLRTEDVDSGAAAGE